MATDGRHTRDGQDGGTTTTTTSRRRGFNFEGLPLDVMLEVTRHLPRPRYDVVLPYGTPGRRDDDDDDDNGSPGAGHLILRTFTDELSALREVYRLNAQSDCPKCRLGSSMSPPYLSPID